MKRFTSLLLLWSGLSLLALADEGTRSVQSELKKEGFYFGEIDGSAGPEFSAALRRYQIRNGLEVTGQSNEETLGSLGIGAAPRGGTSPAPTTPPAPRRAPQPSSADGTPARPEKPRVDLRREESVADSDRRALREMDRPVAPPTRDRSVVPPPADYNRGPVAQGDYRYRELFEATPFEMAPRPLQEQTLRAAQRSLATQGFYQGVLDGQVGPETADALITYQRERRLPPTGRLDLETLNSLHLLPGAGSQNPVLRPFTRPGRSTERQVYRGVWVR